MAVLLGNSGTGVNSANNNAAGVAFANRFAASANGTINLIWLRTGATGPSAGNLHGALYSDTTSGPQPVTRLSGDITGNFVANSWVSFTVSPGLAVTSGTFYWIAWLSVGAGIDYTDFATSGGSARDSTSGLTALPTTWSTSANWINVANTYGEELSLATITFDFSQFPKSIMRTGGRI